MKILLVIFYLTWGVNFVYSQALEDTLDYIPWKSVFNYAPEEVVAIDASRQKWTEIPVEIMTFPNLKGLKLEKNKLDSLPDFIKALKLTSLYLGKNKFTYFPHQIFHISTLERLAIEKNKITTLPKGVKALKSLKHLDIWGNRITTFPEELVEMQQLQYVDARGTMYRQDFITKWEENLPNAKIKFDPPCSCLD